MARNGAGVYSKVNTFVAGNTITAAGHNQNWDDLVAEMTNSVAADGQTPITAGLKGANGTVSIPSYGFNSDPNTGMYRHGADELGFTTGGVAAGYFDSAQNLWLLGGLTAGAGSGVLALTGGLSVSKTLTLKDGGDIASATALTFGDGNFFNITGTTATTSIGTKGIGTVVKLRANAAWPITHHATNLILLSGASITCAAGDMMEFEEYGTGTWRMTAFNRANGAALFGATASPPPGSFKNLSIKVASNTTVTIAADFVTTTDGTLYQTTPVSATCDLGSNGAVNKLDAGSIAIDTWYAIWVIAKADGTTGTLASTSATAPTLPTGYTFKARIGWVRTIHASATLYGTWQFGRRAQYVIGLAQTGANYPAIASGTTTSTPTAFTVATCVPITAGIIHAQLGVPSGAFLAVGPTTASGANGFITITSASGLTFTPVSILLETTTLSYSANNVNCALSALGWEDNI